MRNFISLLARLWKPLWWFLSVVVVGIVVNLLIPLGTSGPGVLSTWVITHQLLAHLLVTIIVLIVALLLILACYLAYRRVRRSQVEQHQAHQEALVVIGRGVHHLLEQAQMHANPVPPVPMDPTSVAPALPLWTVPYRRNLFFTGREDQLSLLHNQLTSTGVAALNQALAISGLGGIGKTQIAVEYAYRYRAHYLAIFWVTSASRETLVADFVALAHRLELPERTLEDQSLIVAAVRRWLEGQPGWLLILDNADELELLPDFLPAGENGSLLLTTRAQATGNIAPSIFVEQMSKEEGGVLLLRRAKMLPTTGTFDQATQAVRDLAAAIVTELDGLPLALDQAGAYIEETACGLASYLDLYRSHRRELLQRRSAGHSDHPEPVATTWHLSFLKIEQASPTAVDLLRLCAFLAPDAIPEEIVTEGNRMLGAEMEPTATNVLRLNEMIEVLRRYSLVRRNPETRMLTIHRVVQAVLQDAMLVEMRYEWKERAVEAVSATFPGLEPSQWTVCERWLPHAFICADWIKQEHMKAQVASRLLRQAGSYMKERAQYTQAKPFFHQALEIDEQLYGADHPAVATDLNDLACLFWNQGKYKETEPLFRRALVIRQQHLGHGDPAIAETLQNLACLYQTQGKHEESERMFQGAVSIDENRTDPTAAVDLSNQADLYRRLGRYEEAESKLAHALAMQEQHTSQDHFTIAHLLHKQGLLAFEQGKFEVAKTCFKEALVKYEQWLGEEHPNTAQILNALAELARIQGKYDDAERLFQQALAIKEKQLGEIHSSTAASLNGLALLYLQQGKWVYVKQGKYLKEGRFEEAKRLFRRALKIRRQTLGRNHPDTALLLNNLACLYQAQGKEGEAERLLLYALTIYEQQLGPEHPGTIQMLHNLIYCYGVQGKYEVAQPLLERALAIDKCLAENTYPKARLLHQDLAPLLEALGARVASKVSN